MKFKKITSLLCAGAMMFCIAASPIGQAQAYTIDVEPSADKPPMPAEVKERCEEGRNHYFDLQAYADSNGNINVDKMYSDEFEKCLIMPGDTFEIPVYIDDRNVVNYVGVAKMGDSNDYIPGYDSISDDFLSISYFNGGYNYSGTVTVLSVDRRVFTSSDGSETWEFPVKYRNDTDCPLFIESHGGGSGPVCGKYTQAHACVNIFLLPPYNGIYYAKNSSDGAVGAGETIKLENFFWRQGSFSDSSFPAYYWISDVPYTFTIPNPTSAGHHFVNWGMMKSDAFPGRTQTADYTTFTVQYDHNMRNSWDNGLGGFDRAYIFPRFSEGHTITFNGRGGTIKGYDTYIAEIPDFENDEEPEDYGYALEDYAPVKEGDTFVGWCYDESCYYDSFLTKDDEAVIYDRYYTNAHWTMTNNIVLYAKWASETNETLEKEGWELTEDGILRLYDYTGAQAWNNARRNDPTLAEKVKSFELGFRDKKVSYLPDGSFYNCVNLETAVFGDGVSLGTWVFQGCTNLKTVKFGKNCGAGSFTFADCPNLETVTFEGAPYSGSQAFMYAPMDLLVTVPEEELEATKEALDEYAYLLKKEKRYPISVNGQLMTQSNLTVACGDGTATYDPETNTLTLDSCEFTKSMIPHSMDMRNWGGNYGGGVVADMATLTVVGKGTNKMSQNIGNLVMNTGDLTVSGGSYEKTVYDRIEAVSIEAAGNLTLDGVNVRYIDGDCRGDVFTINNSTIAGGVFSYGVKNNNKLVIKNSKIEQFVPDDDSSNVLYKPKLNGIVLEVDNSTLDNVCFCNGNLCESITIKDSTVKVAEGEYINAAEGTKLNIINSTLTGKGPYKKGMTTISEDCITLTDCEIVKGTWKGSSAFEILPSSMVVHEAVYNPSVEFDDWYKSKQEDYTFTVTGETDADLTTKLVSIEVYDEPIDKKYYTVKRSSSNAIDITISVDYLNTLDERSYNISVIFDDGKTAISIFVLNMISYSPAPMDNNWYMGSGKDLQVQIFKEVAECVDFSDTLKEVVIDTETIDAKFYTVSAVDDSSVMFTLKAELLETLTEEPHEVYVVFADGKGVFKVIVQSAENNTETDVEPDTEKDTSTDEKPDTEKDMSTDEKPDTEKDTSTDEKPDTEKDTSTDEKPDTEKDTSTDEKPDTEKDTSTDEKPDTEKDTSTDEKPDIEKDTSTDVETDTEKDKESPDQPDTEKDTSTDEKTDTEKDTSTDEKHNTDKDTSTDEKTDTESDTSSDVTHDTDSDKEKDSDTNTDKTDYDFTENETSWDPESEAPLTLTIKSKDGEMSLDKMTGITLNGVTVPENFYTVIETEDGLSLSFSPEVLKQLSSGAYNVSVSFTDGSAEMQVTIGGEENVNYGDIDGDGEITANDALSILRSSVEMAELTPNQKRLADIDNDGEITANDALNVLRYSVGMVNEDSPINKPIAA